jgi:hypothetical protein
MPFGDMAGAPLTFQRAAVISPSTAVDVLDVGFKKKFSNRNSS